MKYDFNWLAILHQTHQLDLPAVGSNPPQSLQETTPPTELIEELKNRYEQLYANRSFAIPPENFVQTQPIYDPSGNSTSFPLSFPQTDALMNLLGRENIFHNPSAAPPIAVPENPEEISLDIE